jgi:hypothetical protein
MFMIQAVDIDHEPINSSGDRIACRLTGPSPSTATITAHVQELGNGAYAVGYIAAKPGDYSIHFRTLSQTKVVGEKFKVSVLPST